VKFRKKVDFEWMDCLVVKPLCRTWREINVALHFNVDIFFFRRRFKLQLWLILSGKVFGDQWIFERRVIADESDLLDESISDFALDSLRSRFGLFGLLLLWLLLFQ
jgi:hypothetical protein